MPTTRRATLVAGNILTAAAGAQAAQYPARGDTGRVHGGLPRPPMGAGQRGSCTSEWMQDTDESILDRCYGEAAVWCR